MLVDMKTLTLIMETRRKRAPKKGSAGKMLGILEGKLPEGMTSVELIRKLREEWYD
ncbi:hypothetical protein [Thermococcus sp. JdF3]|uniref:hypothetical protein n=1 Tax=Thermococcus sp. JdF3 TaxID=1638258 RepID=UPI001439A1DC|nr:hypothetical protein [Thermococcus sp. JdF3]